ncbi:MAG: hypothetical protein EHM20_04420 [Alphaproteobacteria bacterium]|nr:MAG: hypothetical protein EHM20_04420 [Alphaproteobacteria bacterium]
MLLLLFAVIVVICIFGGIQQNDFFKTFGAKLAVDDITPKYTLSQYSEDTFAYPLDSYPDKPGCYSNGFQKLVYVPEYSCDDPVNTRRKLCEEAGHCFFIDHCYRKNVVASL